MRTNDNRAMEFKNRQNAQQCTLTHRTRTEAGRVAGNGPSNKLLLASLNGNRKPNRVIIMRQQSINQSINQSANKSIMSQLKKEQYSAFQRYVVIESCSLITVLGSP